MSNGAEKGLDFGRRTCYVGVDEGFIFNVVCWFF